MKVIFNADDYGLTPGVNTGIAKAHLHGVVNSTTMMVGMEAEEHAVKLAANLPKLKIGLHLRFTVGAPLTGHPNLTNGKSLFPAYSDFWKKKDFEPNAIYEECVAQIQHFLKLGIPLSHIDSHHHAHTHPQLAPVVYQVAKHYQVPLRSVGLPGEEQISCRYAFCDKFFDKGVDLDFLIMELLELKKDYDLVEVMCHPGEIEQSLLKQSSYAIQREKELEILTDVRLVDALKRSHIEVTDYSELIFTSQLTSV
jgi:predicted glycoside hydrolase/deacetylase ChbG (UPF0249 family)